jgi:hypothetical protein
MSPATVYALKYGATQWRRVILLNPTVTLLVKKLNSFMEPKKPTSGPHPDPDESMRFSWG